MGDMVYVSARNPSTPPVSRSEPCPFYPSSQSFRLSLGVWHIVQHFRNAHRFQSVDSSTTAFYCTLFFFCIPPERTSASFTVINRCFYVPGPESDLRIYI